MPAHDRLFRIEGQSLNHLVRAQQERLPDPKVERLGKRRCGRAVADLEGSIG